MKVNIIQLLHRNPTGNACNFLYHKGFDEISYHMFTEIERLLRREFGQNIIS